MPISLFKALMFLIFKKTKKFAWLWRKVIQNFPQLISIETILDCYRTKCNLEKNFNKLKTWCYCQHWRIRKENTLKYCMDLDISFKRQWNSWYWWSVIYIMRLKDFILFSVTITDHIWLNPIKMLYIKLMIHHDHTNVI